jgi:hypothetical protein
MNHQEGAVFLLPSTEPRQTRRADKAPPTGSSPAFTSRPPSVDTWKIRRIRLWLVLDFLPQVQR